MARYRLHVLGLPHTATHPDWSGCAFTQKVYKFVRMMAARGHEIYHYGHAASQVPAQPNVKHITVITDKDHEQAYGQAYVRDQAWRTKGFGHYYRIDDHAHRTFHANTIKALHTLKQPNDFLLCFWGWGHKPIADAHPDMIAIEPGIGYGGAWARWRVYESHSVRNGLGGPDAINRCDQDWYHVVIPNYFDPADFAYNTAKDPYILYLGRVYSGKGVDIAVEATAAAGRRLIVAGQGTLKDMGYTATPDHVTEIGYADPVMRKLLMSKASALFIGSRYGEPFGGVQVEAWLSGTAVISPDYAAFAEFNQHGVTGYRCRVFRDFVQAIKNTDKIAPKACLDHAQQFTLDSVAPQYERYFRDVLAVYTGRGWYEMD